MGFIRSAIWIFLWTVGIMSGLFSLARELVGLYDPSLVSPSLFWSCARMAFGLSFIALVIRERTGRTKAEAELQKLHKELSDLQYPNLSGEPLQTNQHEAPDFIPGGFTS